MHFIFTYLSKRQDNFVHIREQNIYLQVSLHWFSMPSLSKPMFHRINTEMHLMDNCTCWDAWQERNTELERLIETCPKVKVPLIFAFQKMWEHFHSFSSFPFFLPPLSPVKSFILCLSLFLISPKYLLCYLLNFLFFFNQLDCLYVIWFIFSFSHIHFLRFIYIDLFSS